MPASPGADCPTGQPQQVDDAVVVTRAARRLLIRGKSIVARGTEYPLTDRNAPIIEVISLSPRFPGVPRATRLRAVAARRCGMAVASASWGVVVFYKLAAAATNSVGQTFLVLTDRGWSVYR